MPVIIPTPKTPGTRIGTLYGHELLIGSLVRNRKTGDVGAVRWAYQRDAQTDVLVKVDVWRLGNARLWYAADIEFLEDDDGSNNSPSAP